MQRIRLLEDSRQLNGTLYFEFLPGRYAGRCWNEESVFMAEDVFRLIEFAFARHVPGYDHYAFMAIERKTWDAVLPCLEGLSTRARSATSVDGLFCDGSPGKRARDEFGSNFQKNAADLGEVTQALVTWLRRQLTERDVISLLGI